MGFFSFFEKKEADSGSNKKASLITQMPTVKPDAELFNAYDEIFFRETATIKEFSKDDVCTMHEIITKGECGHLNQGRYYKTIFEKFFKDKEWVWPEFEKWNNTFAGLSEYPATWNKFGRHIEDVEISEILELLKVSELKEILDSAGLKRPSNSKKESLIDLIIANPSLNESIRKLPVCLNACSEYSSQRNYWLYETLMRTILFRAKSLYDKTRQSKLGITKRKLLVVFEGDRKFINMALAENPDSLTPLFPGDLSMWKAEILGFE